MGVIWYILSALEKEIGLVSVQNVRVLIELELAERERA